MNVVVDHVTKTIHGAVVLQDISLNFESGKVYGLQGKMDRVKRCFYV